MANKNKKNASPHKILRWSISTDGGILVIFLFIALAVAASLSCFYTIESIRNKPDVARVVVLALGGVAAACGLVLAARRSTKFSEQVDTAQKQVEIAQNQAKMAQKQMEKFSEQVETAQRQLFNEQLGRGAKLLANKKIVMRQTGIRVLADLAEKTPEEIKLIMQIIYDFVCSKAKSPSEDKEEEDKELKNKDDIELSIKTLGDLYNKSEKLYEFKRLLNFLDFHLGELNFNGAKLQGSTFLFAKLQGAHFWWAELQGVDFTFAKLQKANFYNAKLQGANFSHAELQGADCKGAELEWADCKGADFSDAKNLTEKQVEVMIFDIGHPPTLPKDLKQFLDPRRGCEWKKDLDDSPYAVRRFVKSKAEWSEKWVDKWVREYLASILNTEDD